MINSDFLKPGQLITLMRPERDPRGKLEEETAQLFAVVDQCISLNSIQSAMILLYSGIDAMAWLNRPSNVDDVRACDFTDWVQTYFLPDSGFGCTADDLYGARCALLHSNTPESTRHRQGKACKVFYFRQAGQETKGILQLRLSEASHPFMINVDQFVAALKTAVSRFLEDLERDVPKAELVYERIQQSYFSSVKVMDNQTSVTRPNNQVQPTAEKRGG